MTRYIIMEFFCFLSITIIKITNSFNKSLLNFFTLLPSILTIIYLLKSNNIIKIKQSFPIKGLLLAFCGDFFLIYFLKPLGIYLFLLLQIAYHHFLTKNANNKFILFFLLINFLFILFYQEKILIIEGSLYALVSLNNIIKTIYYFALNKITKLYLLAFLFLFICDFNLFFLTFLEKYNINSINLNYFFLSEWLSYIFFQITLVYLTNLEKK